MRKYTIASALITDQDWVLMVNQHRPDARRHNLTIYPELATYWGFPGGKMELGETLEQGLKREILEETGLVIEQVNQPILICIYGDAAQTWQCHVTAYHVQHPHCPLEKRNDPDGDILFAQWFKRDEALALIKRIPWAPMREPMLDYLEKGQSNTRWCYTMQEDGVYTRD